MFHEGSIKIDFLLVDSFFHLHRVLVLFWWDFLRKELVSNYCTHIVRMSTCFNLCLNQCLLFLINVPKINHHRHQIFPPINQSYYYSTLSLGLGCFIWFQVFRSQKFPTPLQHLILSLILIKSHAYYSQSRSHIGKHPVIKTDWHRYTVARSLPAKPPTNTRTKRCGLIFTTFHSLGKVPSEKSNRNPPQAFGGRAGKPYDNLCSDDISKHKFRPRLF